MGNLEVPNHPAPPIDHKRDKRDHKRPAGIVPVLLDLFPMDREATPGPTPLTGYFRFKTLVQVQREQPNQMAQ